MTARRCTSLVLAVLCVWLTAATSWAIPPGGASGDTPGTWSRLAETSIAPGGLIRFTVGGFPAGETLYVKIDDGANCSDASHGACVYHSQKIPTSGVVNGSFSLPSSLPPGSHWLRFLASAPADPTNAAAGTKGFSNASPDFTAAATSTNTSAPPTATATSTAKGRATATADSRTSGAAATATTAPSATTSTGAVAAGQPTVAEQPGRTPEAPADGDAASTLVATPAGDRIVVAVGDRYADEWAFVYVYSEPHALGWQQVADDGTVSLPTTELEPGQHRIAVLDVDDVVLGWATTVVGSATPTAAPTAPPSEDGDGLPVVGLGAVAAAVVVAGAAVGVALRRRER